MRRAADGAPAQRRRIRLTTTSWVATTHSHDDRWVGQRYRSVQSPLRLAAPIALAQKAAWTTSPADNGGHQRGELVGLRDNSTAGTAAAIATPHDLDGEDNRAGPTDGDVRGRAVGQARGHDHGPDEHRQPDRIYRGADAHRGEHGHQAAEDRTSRGGRPARSQRHARDAITTGLDGEAGRPGGRGVRGVAPQVGS